MLRYRRILLCWPNKIFHWFEITNYANVQFASVEVTIFFYRSAIWFSLIIKLISYFRYVLSGTKTNESDGFPTREQTTRKRPCEKHGFSRCTLDGLKPFKIKRLVDRNHWNASSGDAKNYRGFCKFSPTKTMTTSSGVGAFVFLRLVLQMYYRLWLRFCDHRTACGPLC